MSNIKNKILGVIFVLPILLTAIPVFAQPQNTNACSGTFQTVTDFITFGTCLLSNTLMPLLVAVALVVFMGGVIQFIANGGDETKRAQGRQFMLWGIIGMFVMLGIWGIVGVLGSTFGISLGIPQL